VTGHGKVAVFVVKNPFGHHRHAADKPAPPGTRNRRTWLQREEANFEHGRSSLFFLAHDLPRPPQVTCIQGHEVRDGAAACDHGHPVG
jgi:hypothetical protein